MTAATRDAREILAEVLAEFAPSQLVQLQNGGVALVLIECPVSPDDCTSKTIILPRRSIKKALAHLCSTTVRNAVFREVDAGKNVILFDDRGENMTFASTRCYYFPGGKGFDA